MFRLGICCEIGEAFFSLLPIQQYREGFFSANVSLSPFLTAWYTEDISRVWKGERGPLQEQQKLLVNDKRVRKSSVVA